MLFHSRSLLLLLCGHKCLNRRVMKFLEVYADSYHEEHFFESTFIKVLLVEEAVTLLCLVLQAVLSACMRYSTKSLWNFWTFLSSSISSGVLDKFHWVTSLYPFQSFFQWETYKQFSLPQALLQPCCELLEKCSYIIAELGGDLPFQGRLECFICEFKLLRSSFGVGKKSHKM